MASDVNPASEQSMEVYFESPPVLRAEHVEGSFTRIIEQQAAKIPSDVFLFAALCSMALSLGLELRNKRSAARFVGMWVEPLLTMGVYNKLVKLLGPR